MAAPTKPAPGQAFEIARPQGVCSICGQAIAPEAKFMAALIETPTGFVRSDCDTACWPKLDRKDVVAFWQTAMPKPQEVRKRLFVDDQVLCDLFARLADVQEPAKLNFRFVLGLILMRKRLISYDSTRVDGGRELWTVRLKGQDDTLDLLNPRLGEEEIRQVSQQLDQILSQEL